MIVQAKARALDKFRTNYCPKKLSFYGTKTVVSGLKKKKRNLYIPEEKYGPEESLRPERDVIRYSACIGIIF